MKRILSCLSFMALAWLSLCLAAVAAANGENGRTLDLKEALRLAHKANPNLQISRLQNLIAGEDVVRARSGLLPQVKAGLSQTFWDDPVKLALKMPIPGVGVDPVSMTNRNYWSSQVTVDQLLFDFWGTPSKYQAAIMGQSAALLDTAQTRDNIFLYVAQGYFKTLRAIRMVQVAEQEVAQLSYHRKIAQDQYDCGVAVLNDVLQAEVSLADARQRLIVSKTDVVDTRAAFNKLLLVPVSAPTILKDEQEVAPPAWGLGEATDLAIKRRSDLKANQDRIQQQEKVIVQTRAQHFPRIYAQAGYNWQQNINWLHDSQWYGILGMQWSLFTGLDTKAQVAQAKDKLSQLKLHNQDLKEQVALEVQSAYLKVKDTAERIQVAKTAVTQGEENLRLNEERYKEQVGTATDVIDAQTLLTKTRVSYWTALYDHQMAKAQLLWAVGGISELLPQENGNRAP